MSEIGNVTPTKLWFGSKEGEGLGFVERSSMTEGQWSLKEYRPQNSPQRGFFRKNLAPSVKPQGSHAFVAYLTFHFEPMDESGLPSAENSRLLAELEEDASVKLEADGLAIHGAGVLKDGVKDLLFYTRDAQAFLKRVEKYRYQHDQFDVECEISADPGWKHHKDFP